MENESSKAIYLKEATRSPELFAFVESDVVLQTDHAFPFGVQLSNHLLYLGWSDLLVELLGCRDDIFGTDEPFALLVEILEDTLDIFVGVGLVGTLGHEFDELLETDFTAIIRVEITHSDVDEGTSWLISSIVPDGFSEVHGGEHAIIVVVEVVENLFEYFDVSE